MEHITDESLEHLPTRMEYLIAFLDITDSDAAILRRAEPLIAPLIPAILNAVYTKLLSFDITAKAFVPKDVDVDGKLTIAHPQIQMRKDFLRSYLTRLLTTNDFKPTSSFWIYLDRVALMHTGQPSFSRRRNRPKLQVEYIHMSLLLGYLLNLLIDEISVLQIEERYKRAILKVINKVIWVQNDLFARQYLALARLEGAVNDGEKDEVAFEALELDGEGDE